MDTGSRRNRAGAAACAVLVAATLAVPAPAHAFLGGIVKKVGGMLGGGEGEGGGIGCVEIAPGLPEQAGDLGRVVGGAVGGGAWGTLGGWAGDLYGEVAEGCPIVESEPGLIEKYLNAQKIEMVIQTVHMLTQIYNMIEMRAKSGIDSAADVVGIINTGNAVMRRSQKVIWNVEEVAEDFDVLYPEELPVDWAAGDVAAHQDLQAARARDASRLSKQVSANAITSLDGYGARLARIEAARGACNGQTCMIDVSLQQQTLAAEVEAQRLMVLAADVRAREARQDYEMAARERAEANRRVSRRGLTEYGG